MTRMFLFLILESLLTEANLLSDATNASLSSFKLKKPQILIESAKPSMQRAAVFSSLVFSKSTENVLKFAGHMFSKSGLIGFESSTLMKYSLLFWLI